MKKNVQNQVVGAQLVSKTDGSAVTSGTTQVYVTGDNGTQVTSSPGTAVHKGNGYWEYAPDQNETNYDHVAFTFVNSSAVNATIQIWTSFPQTGDNYARLGAPATASLAGDVAVLQTIVNLINGVAVKLNDMTEADTSPNNWRFTIHALTNAWNVARAAAASTGTFGEALDATVSSRLATSGYTAPDNASVTTILALVQLIKAVTDKLGDMTEADTSPANWRFTAHALAQAPTGGSAPTAAAVALAVWDEALGAHSTAGTFGVLAQLIKTVTDKLGDMLEADQSPANWRFTTHALGQVWESLRAAHVVTGSFGEALDATVSSRLASASYTAPDNTTIAANASMLALVKAVTDKFGDMVEADQSPANWRLTAHALSQAPTGGSAPSASTIAAAVWDELTASHTTPSTFGAVVGTNLDAAVSTRLATSGYTAPDNTTITAIATIVTLIKTVTDKLGDMVEADTSPANWRFTAHALANALGTLTLASIADAVWDEAIAGHLAAGSTGLALNDATSAGNPWNSVLEGSYTAQDLLRIVAAVAAGKTTIVSQGGGQALVTFRAIADGSDIASFQMSESERTAATITP